MRFNDPEDAPGAPLKRYMRSRMTRVKAERSVFHTGVKEEPVEAPLLSNVFVIHRVQSTAYVIL